jgi:hypothetical protein
MVVSFDLAATDPMRDGTWSNAARDALWLDGKVVAPAL